LFIFALSINNQKQQTMNNTKTFGQLLFGLIALPMILMVIFTLANKIISMLFIAEFSTIQYSPIWIFWVIISTIIEVYYFSEVSDL